MEKYQTIDFLGEGSFAKVSKAKDLKTGEIVAIKKLKKKYSTWQECVDLREVKSLNKLKQNDNIIKLKEMIRTEDLLYLVFEYMEKNLYELMLQNQTKKFSEAQIRYVIFQTLQGVTFMHKYGFFHRDLKPENLLVNGDKIKIADFGLAREIRSIPPYTDYVSTRYYRAPECILKSTNYNSPVDIWAIGCIMAELYNFKPIFNGATEKEVFFKIASVLGTPNLNSWSEGVILAKKCDIKLPICSGIQFSKLVPNASKEAISLLSEMLVWDPNKRSTASNLLQHPFFTNSNIPTSLTDRFGNENSNNNMNEENDGKTFKSFSNASRQNNNNNKPTHNKNEVSYSKKDEDDISKMLEDTVGFNKFIKKLKSEKMEDDIKFEKERNKSNYFKDQISPIATYNKLEEEFDFEIEKYFGKDRSILTKKDGNSILNMNITNFTNAGGPLTNGSISGYAQNKIFFDNSVINKINQETNTVLFNKRMGYENRNENSTRNNNDVNNHYSNQNTQNNRNFKNLQKDRNYFSNKNEEKNGNETFFNKTNSEINERDSDKRNKFEYTTNTQKNFNIQTDSNDKDSDENLEFLTTRRKNNNFLKLKNKNNNCALNQNTESSARNEYKKNPLGSNNSKQEEFANKNKIIKVSEVNEKHSDLDFENNNKPLKNINLGNNRPFSRKRSAFKFIEEIEKDETNDEMSKKINTKDSGNNLNDKKESFKENNFDNFHNLINNNRSFKEKEQMPEIKNPSTYNKIQMPSLNNNNYNTHSHANSNNTNNMNLTHFNNNSTSRRIHENNFNNIHQTNMPQSSKKPEIESRRRKLVDNNIFNSEFQENLNLTAANPTSNNLLNFENQIKNGYFSNNNIPTPVNNSSKYVSNFTDKDANVNYISHQDKNNSVNSNKFTSANSRINSRREANNINNSKVSNNSYFGNTHII